MFKTFTGSTMLEKMDEMSPLSTGLFSDNGGGTQQQQTGLSKKFGQSRINKKL